MTATWSGERIAALFRALERHTEAAVALRRQLHADPRLSGHEEDTTTVLAAALGMPVDRLDTGGAVLRIGDPDGPAVGLRAELDALPVTETTNVAWRAGNGAMHACGHDVHMAAAVAVARTLRDEGAPVPLVLVLQPREETLPSGAKDVALSPVFAAHDIRAFLGAHVQPRLRQGHFAATPGPVNAAADQFTIVVNGRPGHAAYPHLTADPVVTAADLIGTLQHLISRQVDPTNPTVLTIGSINGGNSPNVVPATVRMSGILRTFDEHDRVRLHAAIESAAHAIADVHGCDAEVEVSLGAPVLENEATLAAAAATWIERAGLVHAPPLRSCGADDFSYYCPLFPSLMVFVGVGGGGPDEPGLHHPNFLPPEETVGQVATAMLAGYLGACSTVIDLPVPEP
ncbi:MAG TPA: M20 family metallopeptidase [Marmoricola sp.]|nr:M20 family metallopeptidase [Marmoricola sp.]